MAQAQAAKRPPAVAPVPPRKPPVVNTARPSLPTAAPRSDERRFIPPPTPKGKFTFKYTLPEPRPIAPKVPGQINLSDRGIANAQSALQYADIVGAFGKGGRPAVDKMKNYTGATALTGLGLPNTIKNYASRAQEPIREAALQRIAVQDDLLTQMDYMDGDEMVKQLAQGLSEIGVGAASGASLGLLGGPFAGITVPGGAVAGTVIGSVVALADLLLSGEVDPHKNERQTVVDTRNKTLGLKDRLDPNRRIGGMLTGSPSFIPSMDRMLFGVPANELKGDNFTGPPGTLSTYFPQRNNPQFPPPQVIPPAGTVPVPAPVPAGRDILPAAVERFLLEETKRKAAAAAAVAAAGTKPPPPVIPPEVPLGPPAEPAPQPGGGGDSGDGMSEFEKLAQLMEVGKYARQPVPEDRTRENDLYKMLQESQNQMQALQQTYIEALIKQLNAQPQPGIPAPVSPGAPAAAAGNMYSLGGIPRVAATGSNLQFSNAGLGYLNSIDPSLLQALMQYLKILNYTGQGQMGSFGEMNYARQGGAGSLLQSDASFENPLAYAGLTPQMREPAEAGLRSLFAQMGLMG